MTFSKIDFSEDDFYCPDDAPAGGGFEPVPDHIIPTLMHRRFGAKVKTQIYSDRTFDSNLYASLYKRLKLNLGVNPALLKSFDKQSLLHSIVYADLNIGANMYSPIRVSDLYTTLGIAIPIVFDMDELNEIMNVYRLYRKAKYKS